MHFFCCCLYFRSQIVLKPKCQNNPSFCCCLILVVSFFFFLFEVLLFEFNINKITHISLTLSSIQLNYSQLLNNKYIDSFPCFISSFQQYHFME